MVYSADVLCSGKLIGRIVRQGSVPAGQALASDGSGQTAEAPGRESDRTMRGKTVSVIGLSEEIGGHGGCTRVRMKWRQKRNHAEIQAYYLRRHSAESL